VGRGVSGAPQGGLVERGKGRPEQVSGSSC
jgi:hypothetical protein